MITFNDLQSIERKDSVLMDFVRRVITDHKTSNLYKIAAVAMDYDAQRNRTIVGYQKMLYTVTGKAVPDNFSANYKLASNFFHRFTTQQNQFLLGNGVQWKNESTADALGGNFDTQLQKTGHSALVGGLSFGFWNLDHVDVFSVLEFAPLWDEENGSLRAGVRFWQISDKKPLRATLYEEDGYTDYIWRDGKGSVLAEKRPYVVYVSETEAGDEVIYDSTNYPTFPIVPCWGNKQKQSEIVGIREQIDTYDLIKSGFANNVDEASMVYWTVQNAGGMDDVDLAKFVERMRTLHASVMEDDGARAESHSIDVPVEARERLLDRLRSDLYDDYMALDVKQISNGAATATQIRAAYEPMNSKADDYEYCINEFVNGILKVAGIDDEPTFTRSTMINTAEEIQTVLQAATHLPDDYVTQKILSILGDGDRASELIAQMDADELERMREE